MIDSAAGPKPQRWLWAGIAAVVVAAVIGLAVGLARGRRGASALLGLVPG